MHITGVSSELQLRAASHLEALGLELAMHVLFAWWKAAHFDRLHPLYYVHDPLLACHRLATFLDLTASVEIVELVSTQLLSQKARLMCVAKQWLVYVDSSRDCQEGASFAAASSCGVPLCGTLRKAPGYASGSLALKTARRAPRNFISYVSRLALVDQLTQAGENLVSRPRLQQVAPARSVVHAWRTVACAPAFAFLLQASGALETLRTKWDVAEPSQAEQVAGSHDPFSSQLRVCERNISVTGVKCWRHIMSCILMNVGNSVSGLVNRNVQTLKGGWLAKLNLYRK